MRKNLIALSVAAFVGGLGMAGGAAAAVIADPAVGPDNVAPATDERVRQSGAGHQLIVPYFNTQVGNATLFNIVNRDLVNGKAVKIRFRGASNSDDILDFQLFLSPGDVWAANISRGADGRSVITTRDRSCTLPLAVGAGAGSTFVTARLPQSLSADDQARETREGYIEIFNMADIPPGAIDPASGAAAAPAAANPLFTAIKHQNGLPPCNGGGTAAQQTDATTRMNALQTDLTDINDARTRGFRGPTAGLFANWTIVNVPKSGSASGEAIALTAVVSTTNSTPGRGNIVFFPQVGGNVDQAVVNASTGDPSFRTDADVQIIDATGANVTGTGTATLPVYRAQFFDLPDLSTPYLQTAAAQTPTQFVNILQEAIATTTIDNEFITDPAISAFTDWVFSQPTRRYGVAADYRPLTASPVGPIRRIFLNGNNYYSTGNTAVNTAADRAYQICVTTTGVTFFDREEFTATGTNFVISPSPAQPVFRLCGETSVLTFNSTGASVLGAEIARTNVTAPSGIRDGWARVSTPGLASATAVGGQAGLPIVGKAFTGASTPTFNISGSWEHRYTPVRTPSNP